MRKSVASSSLSSQPASHPSLFVSIMRQRKQLPTRARKAMVAVMEQVVKEENMVGANGSLEFEIEGMINDASASASATNTHSTTTTTTTGDDALDYIDQMILSAYLTVGMRDEEEEEEHQEWFGTNCPVILQSISGLYQKCLQLPGCPLEALHRDYLRLGFFPESMCATLRRRIEQWLDNSLDSRTDTDEHVETAIRLFPSVLEPRFNNIVVLEAAKRPRTAVFVPLLARLGVEFGSVSDRGGLIKYDTPRKRDVVKKNREPPRPVMRGLGLRGLCRRSRHPELMHNDRNSDGREPLNALRCLATAHPLLLRGQHHELMHNDAINLAVLIELREQKLLFKADIAREDLLECLLQNGDGNGFYGEQRFRYLVEWDPQSLAREKDGHFVGRLPLHESVSNNLKVFSTVLELGLKYFPDWVGFLFQMNNYSTPFRDAFRLHGNTNPETVTDLIDQVLVASNQFGDGKGLQALLNLAQDDAAHLEGVYYILRRDPSLIARALPGLGTWENDRNRVPANRKRQHYG